MFGRLASRGHEVTVVASGWKGASAREVVDGMEVHRVGGRYTYLTAAPAYYRRELAASAADVLVEDLNKVPLFSPLWAREPVVLLVHHLFGSTAFAEASLPLATATWVLERPLGRIYGDVPTEAVSPSTARDLEARGFRPERIEVIPNGVELERFRPDPAEPRLAEPTVLYLGRLKRYKGIDLVIRAVALLRGRGIIVRFLIAGRGDYEPDLRRLVEELDLGGQVELLGFVDEEEKIRLFRRVWAHVLTSEKEGWGLTNLEAGACGTPTIGSDAPGVRDSVVHEETGLLVPQGDVEALAEALERVVTDAGLRRRLGEGARAFAQRFSWERAADHTEAHLESVRAAEGPSPRRLHGSPEGKVP